MGSRLFIFIFIVAVVSLGALPSCALIDGLAGGDSDNGGVSPQDAGGIPDGGPPSDGGLTMPVCATSIFLGSLESGSLGATVSPCDLAAPPLLDLAASCGLPGGQGRPGLVFEFDVRDPTDVEICAADLGEQMQTFVVSNGLCSEEPTGFCTMDSDCTNVNLGPGAATIYWESGMPDGCPTLELSIVTLAPPPT